MSGTSAQSLQEQGVKLFRQKEYESARTVFQQAQTAYEAEGNRVLAAEMMVNIGLIHRALGENQQALDVIQQALAVFEELGDQKRIAMTLGNLGGVYVALNDKEQAYNCYRTAADMFQALGEKQLYGETLLAMGRTQIEEGKVGVGSATYEAGLENMGDLNTRQKIMKSLLGIRNRFLGAGNPPKDE